MVLYTRFGGPHEIHVICGFHVVLAQKRLSRQWRRTGVVVFTDRPNLGLFFYVELIKANKLGKAHTKHASSALLCTYMRAYNFP